MGHKASTSQSLIAAIVFAKCNGTMILKTSDPFFKTNIFVA